jgi:hypothetical protein
VPEPEDSWANARAYVSIPSVWEILALYTAEIREEAFGDTLAACEQDA